MSEEINQSPRFAPGDYRTRYSAPCAPFDERGQRWYKGTGVAPAAHPLAGAIGFGACASCASAQVLVIAAQHSVHMMSGDIYWDYELACEACGIFTSRSYAEN
jgi:hypothetical protein